MLYTTDTDDVPLNPNAYPPVDVNGNHVDVKLTVEGYREGFLQYPVSLCDGRDGDGD